MHLGGHYYNRVDLLTWKGADKSTVASAADCEVKADSLTAGHERKHNACTVKHHHLPRRLKCQTKIPKCYKALIRPPEFTVDALR